VPWLTGGCKRQRWLTRRQPTAEHPCPHASSNCLEDPVSLKVVSYYTIDGLTIRWHIFPQSIAPPCPGASLTRLLHSRDAPTTSL
jgi:hypothetical protein